MNYRVFSDWLHMVVTVVVTRFLGMMVSICRSRLPQYTNLIPRRCKAQKV